MKVENFEAAVHFYGKAIELNPANAVYFCNRCGEGGSQGRHAGLPRGCGGPNAGAVLCCSPGELEWALQVAPCPLPHHAHPLGCSLVRSAWDHRQVLRQPPLWQEL